MKSFQPVLENFAFDIIATYKLHVIENPEDRLKRLVADLLESIGDPAKPEN